MPSPSTRFDPRRLSRLAAIAAAVSLAGVGLIAGLYWLEDHVPRVTIWRARLAFLIALEAAYGVVLGASLLALPVLALWFRHARTRGKSGVPAARGLLLAGSLLAGLLAAEACAWASQRRIPRHSHSAKSGPSLGPLAREVPANSASAVEVPPPTTFAPRSPGDPREILVLGESSAEGVPYNYWVSVGHIVTWQLEHSIPGLKVVPRILAHSGDTLEQQEKRLSDLDRRPDVVIVYCGHNEFTARFDWAREVEHYVDQNRPSWSRRIVARLELASPLCRMIRTAADRCRVAIPPPRGGYRELVDVPAFTPAEYEGLLAEFEHQLDAIVGFAERAGAVPILIAPPGNDSGYEPNRSFLPRETTAAQRSAFEREFLAIRRREDQQPRRCLAEYRKLLDRQPGFAELHYRLARLLERAGAWDEAYSHARAARDLDGLPSRCPSRFHEAYRNVAARHRCSLIDGQAYFHKIGVHGLLDEHLFHDGLHPSLRGQIALAQAVLQALRDRHVFGWRATTPLRPIDPAECESHFGLVPEAWRQICLWGIMFYDLTASARYDPSNRQERRAGFVRAAERIKAGAAPLEAGLPNIGVPEPVPPVPDAATVPEQLERDTTSEPMRSTSDSR
jgi:lysophospholipase L1-like esterase